MFNIILYKFKGENIEVDKTSKLTLVAELSGVLRNATSIITPSIMLELNRKDFAIVDDNEILVMDDSERLVIADGDEIVNSVLSANYCYIPMFNRYYYITDIVSVKTGLWEISMAVDVLMSYKKDILRQSGVISRNEFDYNPLLVDSKIPATCDYIVESKDIISEYNGMEYRGYLTKNTVPNNDVIYNFSFGSNKWTYALTLCPMSKIENAFLQSAVNPAINSSRVTYLMEYAGIMDFFKRAAEPTTFSSNEMQYMNISDCIIDVKILPFSLSDLVKMTGAISASGFSNTLVDMNGTDSSGIAYFKDIYVGGWRLYSDIDSEVNNLGYSLYQITDDTIFSFFIKIDYKEFSSFLDYTPYKTISLYTPFNQFVELDIEQIKNGYVYFNYIIDSNDFSAIGFLSKEPFDNTKINNDFVSIVSFDFGLNYGFTRSNQAEINLKNINRRDKIMAEFFKLGTNYVAGEIDTNAQFALGAFQVIGAAATGAGVPIDGFKNLGQSTLSHLKNNINGVGSAYSVLAENAIGARTDNVPKYSPSTTYDSHIGCFLRTEPFLRITRANYYFPEDYNHLFGRPLWDSRKLSDVHGFTILGNIHLNGFSEATDGERSSIISLLLSGVILP